MIASVNKRICNKVRIITCFKTKNRSKQHQNKEHIEDPEVASFLGSDSLAISHEIEVSYLVNSLLRFFASKLTNIFITIHS